MPIIYFVRHGETDWNAEGRLQGQRDIDLNDLGRVQAAEAAEFLRRDCGRFEDLAYVASPLVRTRETMEIFRDALGLYPKYYKTDPSLKEITFGDWEGMTWPEVRKRDPDLARARERDKWNTVPPGGESYAMLMERLTAFVAVLERDSLLVSHGGVARALMVLLGGVSKVDAPVRDIVQGKVLKFEAGRVRWL